MVVDTQQTEPERPPSLMNFRFAYALLYAAVGVVFPYYVLYFKSVGISYSQIGVLIAMRGVVVILFSQFWGYIADILIGKRAVLVIATIGSGAFFAGLYFGDVFWYFLILLFFQRMFFMSRSHVLNSLLFVQPGGRENFALIRAYGSLGFIVVNVLTGKIAASLGLSVIFPLYLLVSLFILVQIAYLPKEDTEEKHSRTHGFWHVQSTLLKNPCILFLLLVVFFYRCAHAVATIYLSFMIKENGGNEAMVGIFFSYAAVLEIVVFFLLDRIIASVGEVRLIAVAIAAQAVRWLLTYYADSLNDFFIIQSLHCITFGVFYLSAASYINRKAPEKLKASAQTLLGMVYFGFSIIVSQVIGGKIADIKGLRDLYLYVLIFVGIAFLFWIKLALVDKKSTSRK